MGKMVWAAFAVVCFYGALFAAKPMEALNRYNVVLVHGAAPEGQGYGDKCNSNIQSAWNTSNDYMAYQNDTANNEKVSWNLGDAAGMLGAYNQTGEDKLTYCLIPLYLRIR